MTKRSAQRRLAGQRPRGAPGANEHADGGAAGAAGGFAGGAAAEDAFGVEQDDVDSDGDLVFEDPYEDEAEAEEAVDEPAEGAEAAVPEDSKMELDEDGDPVVQTQVWVPGAALPEGTTLEIVSGAYIMHHSLKPEWPCLSFDIVPDKLGVGRNKFPLTAYIVAGTQADTPAENRLQVIRVSDLHRTQHDDDSGSDDDLDDLDDDPVVDFRSINHFGGINRIRCMRQEPHIVATWADTGKVHLWDIRPQLNAIDNPTSPAAGRLSSKVDPLSTFEGHASEGFAMDWSPVKPGRLATGDCTRNIYVWDAMSGGVTWNIDRTPFASHGSSVEDLQWSPNEEMVLASCGVDKTIRIWDVRAKNHRSVLSVVGHTSDINVISWNKHRLAPHVIMSGSDDCSVKVWDLRAFNADNPAAHFKWHTQPITSLEWHPTDETTMLVSSADNMVTIWDLSVEAPDVEEAKDATSALPPQLLFVHQGQTDVKEVHYHPQVPELCMATASDGFSFFMPNFEPPAV